MNDWVRLLQPYEQAIEEIKVKLDSLRDQFRELSEYSPIEFTTARVKRISSILEKASRLSIPLDRLDEEMEDIAGLRVMCQFVDDIYSVVDILKARDGKDFTVVNEKDYIKNPKTSGYKSYHMIIKYPVYTASGEKEVLVEIQIRTLAMNFWATIEHSLNYKYKQQIPGYLVDRLKDASIAASRLDDEMLAISKEVKRAQVVFEEKSNTIKEITNMIKFLFDLGDEEVAMKYSRRFDQLNNVDGVIELQYLHWELSKYVKRRAEEVARK